MPNVPCAVVNCTNNSGKLQERKKSICAEHQIPKGKLHYILRYRTLVSNMVNCKSGANAINILFVIPAVISLFFLFY